MFERLSDRLQDTFRNLAGRGSLSESNIDDAMRDVRRALLEADVNYQVTKDFITSVKAECLGEKVLRTVAPGQQAIKIVHDHLVKLLGEAESPLQFSGTPPVIMLVGLHGCGKTTSAGKLARLLRDKHARKPLLVACDLQRPAAMDQLEILGQAMAVPVFVDRTATDVAKLAVEARNIATQRQCDLVILDTAGRLQVDADLVAELVEVKRRVQPCEILLVADAALGQEAVSVAQHFDQALGITGIILTKLDGDARGGAALSMRQVTGRPIKFVGIGERPQDFDTFYPERMAGRILGMGDVVSLVEKAAEQIQEKEAAEMEEKLRQNRFDLGDFLKQLRMIRRMGGFASLLNMLPGFGQMKELPIDEKHFSRVEGIICAMTAAERQHPDILTPSRRQRIARGSGVQIVAVNQLLSQFEMMRKVMGRLGKGGLSGLGDLAGGLGGLGGGLGGGGLGALGGLGGRGGLGGASGAGRRKGTKPPLHSKKRKKKRR